MAERTTVQRTLGVEIEIEADKSITPSIVASHEHYAIYFFEALLANEDVTRDYFLRYPEVARVQFYVDDLIRMDLRRPGDVEQATKETLRLIQEKIGIPCHECGGTGMVGAFGDPMLENNCSSCGGTGRVRKEENRDKTKVSVTVPETLTGIANQFLQSITFPTPKPDGGLSPPPRINIERGSRPLGGYVVESLNIRPTGGFDAGGSPRATFIEVVAIPIKHKAWAAPAGTDRGRIAEIAVEDDVFVCPECKVEHSRGPLDPLSKVYRCLNCGYSGPKVDAENKRKETPPIPAEVRKELDDDAEVYGNAFALFSRGEWRRLDPLKVKLDLREKETADDPCPKCKGTGRA